ncbi:MAG TPA: hypothetical protein VKS21_03700 [Spirochaetota bacterium]|nr:hypothetical protein [Spirochaetota bacterium]
MYQKYAGAVRKKIRTFLRPYKEFAGLSIPAECGFFTWLGINLKTVLNCKKSLPKQYFWAGELLAAGIQQHASIKHTHGPDAVRILAADMMLSQAWKIIYRHKDDRFTDLFSTQSAAAIYGRIQLLADVRQPAQADMIKAGALFRLPLLLYLHIEAIDLSKRNLYGKVFALAAAVRFYLNKKKSAHAGQKLKQVTALLQHETEGGREKRLFAFIKKQIIEPLKITQ